MHWITRLGVRRAEGETFLLRRGPVPPIDPSYGDPRRAAVRAAAAGRGAARWPEIRAHLAAARDDEDLTFLVEGLQSVPGVETWIGGVLAAEPGDALALLVSGARHVAWAGRTPGPAELVRTRLETAEEHLLAAAGREPGWAAPRYFLQVSGRALRLDAAAAGLRFAATRERAPLHAAAHREHLRRLSRRWGGSAEEMHAFARASMLADAEGGRMGELVAFAVLEEWHDLGGDPESAFWNSVPVVHALREAAGRSVAHPAYVRRPDWPLGFNAFAMAFALAGDRQAARPLFRALGDRATRAPWDLLDERSPLVPFRAWRSRMGR